MAFRNTINLETGKKALTITAWKTLVECAEFVADKARAYCPVDTGHLRNSITVLMTNTEDMTIVYVGAYYAPFVEFGHMTTAGTWVPPEPFLRPALQDGAAAFPSIAQNSWLDTVQRGVDAPYLDSEFTARP